MLAHERIPARWQRGGRRPATAMLIAAAALLAAACSAGTAGRAGPGSSPVASLPGHRGGSTGAAPPLTTASSDQDMINFTRCMRSHDIAMLDPTPQGQLNLGNVPGMSGDFGRYSPQFRAADAACRHLLPAGVHDDGTGP
jgi:hypothetical protein